MMMGWGWIIQVREKYTPRYLTTMTHFISYLVRFRCYLPIVIRIFDETKAVINIFRSMAIAFHNGVQLREVSKEFSTCYFFTSHLQVFNILLMYGHISVYLSSIPLTVSKNLEIGNNMVGDEFPGGKLKF